MLHGHLLVVYSVRVVRLDGAYGTSQSHGYTTPIEVARNKEDRHCPKTTTIGSTAYHICLYESLADSG